MANTVLVTGADGFIGSHLTEELVKKGGIYARMDRIQSSEAEAAEKTA